MSPPQATLKSLHSFLTYFFPALPKVYATATRNDAAVCVRALCEGLPKGVSWREGRAWLVQEGPLGWVEGQDGKGNLVVKGFVRGGRLSTERLVHLPNVGDFQVDKVRSWRPRFCCSSPPSALLTLRPRLLCPLRSQILSAPIAAAAARGNAMAADAESAVLSTFNAETADTLDELNEPDFMENEQTWPTEEEMAGGGGARGDGSMGPPALPNARTGTTPRSIRKVPKGTSAYQAAWIGSDDDGEDDDGSDDGSDMDDGSDDDERLQARDDVDGMDGLDGRDDDDDENVEVESRRGGDTASVRFTDRDEVEEQARCVLRRVLARPLGLAADRLPLPLAAPRPQPRRV